MKIKLKLKSIAYDGKSIGEDVRIEVQVLDKKFEFGEGIRVKRGTTFEFNQDVGVFEIDESTEIKISVTEKDRLFSDVGKIRDTLKIKILGPFPQIFEYQVKVRERRMVFWKKTAVFTIRIEAEAVYTGPTVDNPKWTGKYEDDNEQMILARAIWGEARGTSLEVRTAVAWSIKNRVNDKKNRWGKTYYDVILKEDQYSAFWEAPGEDPNLKALRDPIGITDNPKDHEKWKETYQLAGKVMEGKASDPTNGANHYYDNSIPAPYWATKETLKIQIGPFYFHEL